MKAVEKIKYQRILSARLRAYQEALTEALNECGIIYRETPIGKGEIEKFAYHKETMAIYERINNLVNALDEAVKRAKSDLQT